MPRPTIPFAILTAAILAPTATAQADGSIAPRNTWHVRGGCASRGGCTDTAAPDRELELGWTRDFEGEIEQEPLVWGEWVLVCEHRNGRRYLHSLDLRSGEELRTTLSFGSDAPLAPSVWGRDLVLRVTPDRLGVYRARRGALVRTVSYKQQNEGTLSEPLVFGDELYVRDGGEVVRLSLRGREQWRSGDGLVGELSLLGDHLCVMRRGTEPAYVRVRRSNGQAVSKALPPGSRSWSDRTQVLAGPSLTVACLDGKEWLLDDDRIFDVGIRAEPVVAGSTLVMFSGGWFSGYSLSIVRKEKGGVGALPIATSEFHKELVDDRAPLSVSGRVCFHPRIAFHLDDLRVLWRRDESSSRRVVPARESVLFTAEKRLELWREKTAAATAPAFAAAAAAAPARAVLADGTVWTGEIAVEDGALRLDGETVSLDEVLVMTAADGVPLHWTEPERLEDALRLLVEDWQQEQLRPIVQQVGRTKDAALIERAIELGRRLDVAENVIEGAERKLAALRKSSRPARINEKLQAEIAERLAALDDEAVAFVWSIVRATPQPVATPTLHGLWRAMLALDPDHADVCAAIRAALPDVLPPPQPFEPRASLDFIEACAQVEFEVVEPDPMGRPEQAELAHLRETWRPDLIGVLSENLLVLSPPDQPGAIARCLSAGELACDALESMFPGSREGALRMRIFLFGSEKAYHEHSPAAKAGHDIGWTAGHYSPRERISRMFIPAADEEFARIRGTFVHELTHHWLDERGPGFGTNRALVLGGGLPGYWIVEGFASFVEEFAFDDHARSWTTENPRSGDLDVLRNTTARQRIRWEDLFAASHVAIARALDTNADMPIARSYTLGQYRLASAMTLFYAQSASACHYLFHAEGGKYREPLLQYVRDYYGGKYRELDVETVFGVSAKQLGRGIVEYASARR